MVCAFVNCGETVLPALAMAQQCLLRLCNKLQQATNSLFFFQLAKAEQGPIANYRGVDFSEF
jgi:hypothetical protein